MENTEKTNILIQQYRVYIESKDRFVERNFQTNKFFLVFITLLFMILCFINESLAYNMTSTIVFAGIGIGVSFLWWANTEAYEYLINVKYNKVINKIEELLPFQAYSLEKEGLNDIRQGKLKLHLSKISYSEVQKVMAIGSFFLFFIMVIIDILPVQK